jgi:hypothetical protein
MTDDDAKRKLGKAVALFIQWGCEARQQEAENQEEKSEPYWMATAET